MQWPWHVKVMRANGTVGEHRYNNDFDALGFAKWASALPGVERVELSVTFVNGEATSKEDK